MARLGSLLIDDAIYISKANPLDERWLICRVDDSDEVLKTRIELGPCRITGRLERKKVGHEDDGPLVILRAQAPPGTDLAAGSLKP